MALEIQIPDSLAKLSQHFCGCGDSGAAWDAVRNFLEYYEWKHDSKPYDADLDQHLDPHKTGSDYIVAYLLDHLNLTEHGCSVHGAWLTDDGKEVLEFLRRWGNDWLENKEVEFVDSEQTLYNPPGI